MRNINCEIEKNRTNLQDLLILRYKKQENTDLKDSFGRGVFET